MDPVTVATVAAIAAKGIAGVGQIISGNKQEKEAARIAANNPRPIRTTPLATLDNNRIATSRAAEGLSDGARQVYTTAAERGLTTGVDAILKGGGSVNNIADLYSGYESGISRMSLVDEEMRSRNMQAMYGSNSEIAANEDTNFQVNQWGPFADKAQAAATLRKQGSENEWKGINTSVSAISDAAVAGMYSKEGANVFSRPTGQNSPPPIQSNAIRTQPTPTQIIQGQFPGLMNPGFNSWAWQSLPIPQ